MTLRGLFILLLTLSVAISGISQKHLNFPTWKVDSLLLILPDQQAEERVNSLNNLAVSLSFVDAEVSRDYADKAMNLSDELNYMEGKAGAFRNYGHIFQYQGNYPQALNNYLKALSLYDKLGIKHTSAWVCYDIARTHYFAHNYEKTIEYGYQALDIFRERNENGTGVGDLKDTIAMYGGIAETYGSMGNDKRAEEIFLMVDNVINQSDNYCVLELVINAWATGATLFYTGKTDSAKIYLQKALNYPDQSPHIIAVKNRALIFLGILYWRAGEVDSAIYYYKTAFDWYNKNGILYWALTTSKQLGYVYYKTNRLEKAEKYFIQSESIFNKMIEKKSWYSHDSLESLVTYGLELYFPLPTVLIKEMIWQSGLTTYYWLYKINEAKKKNDKALKYHIAYTNGVDTLNKMKRRRETIELQTKYESDRNEEQIGLLSQENALQELRLKQSRYFLFSLGGLVIFVILVAIFIIRLNKLRDRQQTLALQQKLFRSQMNPHFIFNSLTSIQNYILDEEADKASKYLSRFAKLIRNILDSSIEESVPLQEEISTIENYLELQQIRFKNKFDYFIDIGGKIKPDNISIPPMLAQPFIENAIEHGIKYKKSKGNIYLRFRLKNNYLVFEVEDDGVGRMQAKEILYKLNNEHKSLATAITHERIRVMNKKRKKKITLQILDLKDNNDEAAGTKVLLTIPIDL